MHIEPGLIISTKIIAANITVFGVLAYWGKDLIKVPSNIVKTLFSALFFSLFMQAFHLSAGPSELHFLGAMPLYLLFGFTPVLFGFALGLLLQGLFLSQQT